MNGAVKCEGTQRLVLLAVTTSILQCVGGWDYKVKAFISIKYFLQITMEKNGPQIRFYTESISYYYSDTLFRYMFISVVSTVALKLHERPLQCDFKQSYIFIVISTQSPNCFTRVLNKYGCCFIQYGKMHFLFSCWLPNQPYFVLVQCVLTLWLRLQYCCVSIILFTFFFVSLSRIVSMSTFIIILFI